MPKALLLRRAASCDPDSSPSIACEPPPPRSWSLTWRSLAELLLRRLCRRCCWESVSRLSPRTPRLSCLVSICIAKVSLHPLYWPAHKLAYPSEVPQDISQSIGKIGQTAAAESKLASHADDQISSNRHAIKGGWHADAGVPWWISVTHRCRVGGLLLLGAVGAEVLPGVPRKAGLPLHRQRLAGAGRIAVGGLLAPARIVALQTCAAAALVPVEGRQVVEAPALLAEALALALPDDAAHLPWVSASQTDTGLLLSVNYSSRQTVLCTSSSKPHCMSAPSCWCKAVLVGAQRTKVSLCKACLWF